MITILVILCLILAPFGLGVTGIILSAIDFSHGIFTAKSICFMVFGLIGAGLGITTLIKLQIDG